MEKGLAFLKKNRFLISCAAAGIALLVVLITIVVVLTAPSDSSPSVTIGAVGERELVDQALDIAEGIKRGDYNLLASYVHPEYGVYFCPSATVSLSSNRHFSASEVNDFAKDTTTYIWGIDTAGDSPIEMTPDAYFVSYVFDADYANPTMIGINHIVKSGNELDNVSSAFPGCRYIDLYYGGTKVMDYADWSILRLVFEDYDGTYMLTAVIHSDGSI